MLVGNGLRLHLRLAALAIQRLAIGAVVIHVKFVKRRVAECARHNNLSGGIYYALHDVRKERNNVPKPVHGWREDAPVLG